MRRFLAAALFLALLPSLLTAAAPELSVPAKVSGQPGAFVSVAAKTSGKTVAWLSLDAGLHLFPVELLRDSHTAVVSSGTPGSYRLLAVTAAGDEVSQPAVCTVVIEGPAPAPAPAPAPQPSPQPAPQPVGRAAWAIVVVDNTARTPAIGQLLGSQSLLLGLKSRGVTLRVLDVTDPLVKENGYRPSVDTAGGPPVLLVYDAGGKKIKVARLPADESSFLSEFPAPAAASPCGPNGCPASPFATPLFYQEFVR